MQTIITELRSRTNIDVCVLLISKLEFFFSFLLGFLYRERWNINNQQRKYAVAHFTSGLSAKKVFILIMIFITVGGRGFKNQIDQREIKEWMDWLEDKFCKRSGEVQRRSPTEVANWYRVSLIWRVTCWPNLAAFHRSIVGAPIYLQRSIQSFHHTTS